MSAIVHSPNSLYKSLMPTNASDPIAEYHLPELYCTFTVYKLHPKVAAYENESVLYIYIEYDKTYDGLSYMPCMDLAYRPGVLERLLKMGELRDNLIEHYLTGIMLERPLDEYYQ